MHGDIRLWQRTLLIVAATLAAVALLNGQSLAQGRPSHTTAQTGNNAKGDAVIDGLKFHPAGGFIQVFDAATNQTAGTIIFPPNQAPVFAPMPGYDTKIKEAYEKYAHGDTGAAAQPAGTTEATAPAAASTPAPPAFDAASKTVTLSDGRAVTFVDNDNLKVQMPGPAGQKIYELHYHGKSGGGIARTWADTESGKVGGSMSGSGVTMNLAPQNGMPGGTVYDTARGVAYGNSGLAQAKSITAAVREAVDVVKNGSDPSLTKLTVVKSLLSNNLGL